MIAKLSLAALAAFALVATGAHADIAPSKKPGSKAGAKKKAPVKTHKAIKNVKGAKNLKKAKSSKKGGSAQEHEQAEGEAHE
jgi:hypothetical protein